MKPRPDYQRRQAHRQRKALGRALHQVRAMRRPWFRAWRAYVDGRAPKPGRIKLPYMLKQRRTVFYREMVKTALDSV